jgi:hypothetical protein
MALSLDSLQIHNFRGFDHLRIERLGRVNLITGKNGVGKSALLEAVWLYARRGAPDKMLELLDSRDELPRRPSTMRTRTEEEEAAVLLNFKHFFYGRKPISEQGNSFAIGRNDRVLTAVLKLRASEDEGDVPWIEVVADGQKLYSTALFNVMHPHAWEFRVGNSIPCYYVKASGLTEVDIAQLWDNIALTPHEDSVIAAINIIAADIKRVTFINENDKMIGRIPVAIENGASERLPLRSLGEGMSRLFGLALALVNARDGILLIDEVESGLHYSILPDVFKLIFRVAKQSKIQVFATTHSWEAIEAFQQAAKEDNGEESMLIRLQNRKSRVIPTLFDEQALSIATREQIEVR